jgi:Domain of unknown function (DUF4287)
MTFQSYFRRLATDKGLAVGGKLKPGVKAGAAVARLKADFALGHGHAMAIVGLLEGKKDDCGCHVILSF